MGKFLVVARREKLNEYLEIAEQYGVGFEYNDFFVPDFLDDTEMLEYWIQRYREPDMPCFCTMHGVFFDIIPFSYDSKIREASRQRMKQSMEVASRLGVQGVVFHTNCYPLLSSPLYNQNVIDRTVECLEILLKEYPDINIYLENMFDADPEIMEKIAEKLIAYPNFGLCLDYAHASISPTSIEEWVTKLAPYVKHLHINDNDLKKDLHLPVGKGLIDWKQLKQYYDMYFTNCSVLVETNLPEDQRETLEFLRNQLNISID